jgi:hypothetical protein
MTKTGRNELCSCGSGKKHKRCCGAPGHQGQDANQRGQHNLSPEDFENGLSSLADYFDKFVASDNEGDELTAQAAWFDLLYEPGTEKGVPEDIFLPWLYFDVRFGKSDRTLSERFIKSEGFMKLRTEDRNAVRSMSSSCPAFYETVTHKPGVLVYRELGTGKEWKISDGDEEGMDESEEGDLQYIRLLGTPDRAFMFDAPWPVDNKLTENIEIVYEARWAEAKAETAGTMTQDVAFIEFNKGLSSFWAGYINEQVQISSDGEGTIQLFNTEGHILRFCEVVFTIKDEADFVRRLSAAKDFQYHEDSNLWVWTGLSGDNDEDSLYAAPDRADLSIKDTLFVGETNSKERAERLQKRVEEIAKAAVAFLRIVTKDIDSDGSGENKATPKGKKKR